MKYIDAEKLIAEVERRIEEYNIQSLRGNELSDLLSFINSLQQKPAEWSEEDEEMLEYIIGDVNDATQLYTTRAAKDMADKEIAWLKSLRPSWKPSEEPNIELIQRSWYMEGYNDCKSEKEPVWIISTGPGGPQYKLNPNREGGRD